MGTARLGPRKNQKSTPNQNRAAAVAMQLTKNWAPWIYVAQYYTAC